MTKKSYWNLLILCTVLSQGIAVLLDVDIDESTHLHIRQERVIKLDKGADDDGRQIRIDNAPYVVNIQKNDVSICAGSILSAAFVLAPEPCVIPSLFGSLKRYTILSGSALRNHGTVHTIQRRIFVEPSPTLVLFEASPHFDFHRSPNRPISLFLGVVPDVAFGSFNGWGCTQPGNLWHKAVYPERLMQARLYIIPLAECMNIYRRRIPITNEYICTLDRTKRRGTCIGDLGGPLADEFPPLMAPHLLGVMYGLRGEKFGKDPDVFINLNRPNINEWISHAVNNHALH